MGHSSANSAPPAPGGVPAMDELPSDAMIASCQRTATAATVLLPLLAIGLVIDSLRMVAEIMDEQKIQEVAFAPAAYLFGFGMLAVMFGMPAVLLFHYRRTLRAVAMERTASPLASAMVSLHVLCRYCAIVGVIGTLIAMIAIFSD